MLDTILFDLDGTLLPFEQEAFIERYFDLIAARALKFGYEKEPFIKALWAGTKSMMKNDGSRTNHAAFWQTFSDLLGEEVLELEGEFEDFYSTDFNQTKDILQYFPDHSDFIGSLRERGFTVALATNPLFPAVAVSSRLGWVGLRPQDFSHITNYTNSRFSKSNPGYYKDVLRAINKPASSCLMVGNNVDEDMCAGELGLEVFLLSENIETTGRIPAESFRGGTLEEFKRYAKTLPSPK